MIFSVLPTCSLCSHHRTTALISWCSLLKSALALGHWRHSWGEMSILNCWAMSSAPCAGLLKDKISIRSVLDNSYIYRVTKTITVILSIDFSLRARRITTPVFDSVTNIMTDMGSGECVVTDGIMLCCLRRFCLVYTVDWREVQPVADPGGCPDTRLVV